MMKKRIRQVGAAIVAAALVFSAFVLPDSFAAKAVDTDKKCSIEINVGKNTGGNFKELNALPVTIALYKVADIDREGNYTAKAGYESVSFDVHADTIAQEWSEMAAQVKALLDAPDASLQPEETVVTDNGTVTVEDLEVGLYLIDAQQALSDAYQYDFTPYLVSLPNNYYYSSGDDTWVYDQTGENAIGLKPEKSDRYGSLLIEKTLDVYNATNGGATFVFQIEGTKTDVDSGEVREVYSDVVSLTFTEPGTRQLLVEGIPAGTVVQVTEVYSGGNYKLTSEQTVEAVIQAENNDGTVATVTFSNTHDGRNNGGSGVVNHFEYDSETNSWTHSATEDSAA